MIIHAENMDEMRTMTGGSVDFAYLDPPFFTQRDHKTKSGEFAFSDKWENREHFIRALTRRVLEVHRVLAAHGTMVLHLDPKTSHYAKIMCDRVFGESSFASEVIWRYRRWPTKTKNLQRVHDVMLRYVKTPGLETFTQLYEPPSSSTIKAWGNKKQRAVIKDGKRIRSVSTAEESPGVPLGDVWDIGVIAPISKERTGYPTQKPESLIERWLEICTSPGDLVLDPYMGSGTVPLVASRMGRSYIAIDSSIEAVRIARERLTVRL